MSWNIKKAGKDKELLKAAVMAEYAPQAIKDEIVKRIDDATLNSTSVLLVESYGHIQGEGPYSGVYDIRISVVLIPYIDTPA